MNTRTERTGNMRIEQPVGQQWWDNPTPQPLVLVPFVSAMQAIAVWASEAA